MRFKQLLIGAWVGVISCGTFAESQWKYVGTTDNGIMIAVDTNSISKVSEYGYQQNKKFWTKHFIYQDLIQDGLAVGDYRMALTWVNCNDKTYGTKSVTVYKKQKNGMMDTESQSYPYVQMDEVIPGSMGEDILNIVCS